MKKPTIVLCLIVLTSAAAFSQNSGAQYHESGVMRGNRVITSFGNWGVIGQPAPLVSRGAWIYPTNGYIGDLSVLLGIELPVRDYNGDGIPDTVHSVITCNVYRPTPITDSDPKTGTFWTFEPEQGYFNTTAGSPAMRSQPSTWPSIWPDHPEWGSGHWNGLRGPDSLSGDDETYFRMDDRNDERFNIASNNPRGIVFRPDSINPGRRGAGISLGVRYIQSAYPLFRDLFFRVFDIRNEGTTDYKKVVFGTLTGTYIGITGTDDSPMEWNNDAAVYFSSGEFILAMNFPENSVKNPLWQGPVGKFGEAFIQSPAGLHVASYEGFAPASQISLGNDGDLWNRLSPGTYANPASVVNDTVALNGEDMDYTYGSGYFSLNAGETKRVVTVLAYGYTKEEIRQKILLAQALWNSGLVPGAVTNSVKLPEFSSHRFLSGLQVVHWTTAQPGGTVSLWYSPDAGANWKAVALGIPNAGSALWNTADFPDAAFGMMRVFASDTAGRIYGMAESGSYLTVNNSPGGAPFVRIMTTGLDSAGTISQPTLDLSLLIGDPTWGSLNVSLLYRVGSSIPFTPFESYVAQSDTVPRSHPIALRDLPNSSALQLEVIVSGAGGTYSDSTMPFNKQTTRAVFPPGRTQFNGLAQVPLRVSIQDSARVRPDTYVITFNDTASTGPKTFSVFDRTKGGQVAGNVPLYPKIESTPFDGLVLYTEDTTTSVDTSRTKWNRLRSGVTWRYAIGPFSAFGIRPGYRQPSDYTIAFSNTIADTTKAFNDIPEIPFPATPVKHRVLNVRTGQKVSVAGGWLDPGEEALIFLEDVAGIERPTWMALLMYTPPDSIPGAGDTLYFSTRKGLSFHDTLTVSGFILSVAANHGVPAAYALEQNYPNPFNPSTQIVFRLPVQSWVTLTVFNLLGQRVAQLVNGLETPGSHSVEWRGVSDNGLTVASGVYFCRIEAKGVSGGTSAFTQTMKMLYLR